MGDNVIERALKEIPNDKSEIDPNLAMLHGIMDVMSEKTKLVEKFMSPEELKTQLRASEQKLVPMLEIIADNPFPEMINHSPKLKMEFRSPELEIFLSRYIELGLAVERKGRKEDMEAIRSLNENDMDLILKGNRNNNQGGGLL
jgi:hypothetical protein